MPRKPKLPATLDAIVQEDDGEGDEEDEQNIGGVR